MFFRTTSSLARLAQNKTVAAQPSRSLYPFSSRVMAVRYPDAPKVPVAEKIIVYIGFVVGILGPPAYIMRDVANKRPDRKNM